MDVGNQIPQRHKPTDLLNPRLWVGQALDVRDPLLLHLHEGVRERVGHLFVCVCVCIRGDIYVCVYACICTRRNAGTHHPVVEEQVRGQTQQRLLHARHQRRVRALRHLEPPCKCLKSG